MKVIKNSILLVLQKAGLEGLDEVFTGPTAVAFSNEDVKLSSENHGRIC